MSVYVLSAERSRTGDMLAPVVPFGTVDRLSLSCSVISSVSRVFRLRSAVCARFTGLHFQFVNVLGSPECFRDDFEDHFLRLSALVTRLDNISVVCNDAEYRCIYSEWKSFPLNLENHSILLFGSFTKKPVFDPAAKRARLVEKGAVDEVFYHDELQNFVQKMKEGMQAGRRTELLRRLSIEVEDRYNEGWYFVFNTLTVAPEHFSKVFPEKDPFKSDLRPSNFLGKGNAWSDYVRFVDRYFGINSFGSWSRAAEGRSAGQEFHLYFGVVEKGSNTGRLHIHVLHIFRDLPPAFSDPNSGAVVARFREISAMKSFWKYGFSSPVAVRFCANDSYGRKKWRWPCKEDGENGQVCPLPSKPFGAIVGYVGKYISKDVSNGKGCIWRTRVSRNLGKRKLQLMVSQLSLKCRIQLLRSRTLVLSVGQSRVPRMMMRRLLLRSLPVRSLNGLFRRAQGRPTLNIFARFRALMQGILVCSRPSFGSTVMEKLRMKAVSDVFQRTQGGFSFAGPTYAV